MKFFRRLANTIPAVLLIVCLAATWWTRGAMTHLPFLRAQQAAKGTSGNLADHEVDQAFAFALRQASLRSHTLTGDALAVEQKVAQFQAMVKEDQAHVDTLTASLKQP